MNKLLFSKDEVNYMENQKWYENKNVIILLLVFFFPLGLYYTLKNKMFSKGVRIALTTFFVFIIIIVALITPNIEKRVNNEKQNQEAIEEASNNGKFIPEKEFGWYRAVIPEYTLSKNGKKFTTSLGEIKVGKSLIYISFNDYNWIVFHSVKGSSFIGSGSVEFEKGSTNDRGTLFGEMKNQKGETGGYTVRYEKKPDGTYSLTLVGTMGQPDVTLERLPGEVTTESFLDDYYNTILK